MRGLSGLAWALLAASLLGACAHEERVPIAAQAAPEAPEDFPLGYYQQAAAQGRPVFRVLPGESLVSIVVRRGGPLARLGHDHVVSGADVQGYADPQQSRADLFLLLDALVVDDPALRAQAGLDTQPSAADIAGTRSNMLAVLDAQRHPHVVLRVHGATRQQLSVDITLHGVTRKDLQIPATVALKGDALTASGQFAINQSDFGITPFSILGGAIRVEDRLELHFRISARRLMP